MLHERYPFSRTPYAEHPRLFVVYVGDVAILPATTKASSCWSSLSTVWLS